MTSVSTQNLGNDYVRIQQEQRALEQQRQQAAAAKAKPVQKPPLTGHPVTRVATPATPANTPKPAHDGESRGLAREQAALPQGPPLIAPHGAGDTREAVPKGAALAPFQLVRTVPPASIAAPGSAAPASASGLVPASQADPATWMSQSVEPSTSLAKLTLPGTHDSAATRNLGLPGSADAQHMPLKDQLDNGVRFLDLRFKLEAQPSLCWKPFGPPSLPSLCSREKLQVYHGVARQPLSGEEALQTVADFLHKNPGESVVVSIKNEGGGDDAKFQKAVEGLMSKVAGGPASNLVLGSKDTVPTLEQAQGKIVLVRRYAAPDSATKAPLGIDATAGWPNGTSEPTGVTANGRLHVEDHYNNFDGSGTNQEEKWRDVRGALDHSASDSGPDVLHLAFSSATGTSPFGNPTWEAIPSFSDPINRQLIDYAATHQTRLGIVAVDRADPDVIRALINTNG